MRKAAGVLSLAIVGGIAAYLYWAYPRLPAAVPVRYSMANMPIAFGTRELFVGVPAVLTVALFALFLAAARTWPKTAWFTVLALGVVLFFVHVRVQAVLASFLPIPENVAVVASVIAVALLVAATFAFRKPAPAKRVQPF
ncbi:MAG TPA: hypothetical protein VF950_28160 [Planctomycetota bacterium]